MKRDKLNLAMTVMEDNAIIKKPMGKLNRKGRSRKNRHDRYGDCTTCVCNDCLNCPYR